jgi:hypothetical protein
LNGAKRSDRLTFASVSDISSGGAGGKMRISNVLAALSAVLLMAGGAPAKEKADQPKPRKVCRTEQMPGRITPKRVCRIVPPSGADTEDSRRKAGDAREAGDGRN